MYIYISYLDASYLVCFEYIQEITAGKMLYKCVKRGISAIAAGVLYPIITNCEQIINLRVDKNMYARISFPPHHLAAVISFM